MYICKSTQFTNEPGKYVTEVVGLFYQKIGFWQYSNFAHSYNVFTLCLIYSNSSHDVDWSARLSNIILKVDTLRMIQAKFNLMKT